jgi:sugar/nucleoside kinase (ribokinase family)
MTPDYLLIGHIPADLTPEGRVLGGTVSYAARVVNAFGLQAAALTSSVPDEPLLDELRPYAEIVSIPAQATSTFENIYTPEGRIQYIRGVGEKLTAAHIPPAWNNPPLVHLAPLTDEVDPQIAHCFPNSTVLLTLQGWLRRWDADGRVRFKPWHDAAVLKSIDIVVFSEEDIVESPGLEQEFAQSVEHLIVTRAERGGTYYHQGRPSSYATPQVETLYPTGAGDVFAGALLSALHLLDGDMHTALRAAARIAATSVTRPGIEGAPTPEEVRQAFADSKQ